MGWDSRYEEIWRGQARPNMCEASRSETVGPSQLPTRQGGLWDLSGLSCSPHSVKAWRKSWDGNVSRL